MELVKETIRMQKRKCKSNLQMTLEDDFNVPDTKPDVDKIITEEGNIEITETNLLNGKWMVKGVLHFQLLYSGQDGEQQVHNIEGRLPFDEMINMEDLQGEEEVKLRWEIEDLNISLINSRKISVKSLVSLVCCAYEICEEEVATQVEEQQDVPCKYETRNMTELVVDKKDVLRLKEEFHLPTGKKNIYQVLYRDIRLEGLEMRTQEGQIFIRGEMVLFVLYTSQETPGEIEYYEAEQPVHSVIPCNGCMEDMILQVDKEVVSKELQIKPDEDGEERVLEAELAINLGIAIYREKQMELLADLYSTTKQLEIAYADTEFLQLLTKNTIEKRLGQQFTFEKLENPIVQICHNYGNIQLDEVEWREDGIYLEGSVEVKILYLGEQRDWPVGEEKCMIPFTHLIEKVGNSKNKDFEIYPEIGHISTVLLGRDSVDVKVNLNIELFVFERKTERQMKQITEKEFSPEEVDAMPGMVGYLVKEGEDLWSIAKQFHVTIDKIREINDLENQNVKGGERLLLSDVRVVDA